MLNELLINRSADNLIHYSGACQGLFRGQRPVEFRVPLINRTERCRTVADPGWKSGHDPHPVWLQTFTPPKKKLTWDTGKHI